MLVRKIKKCPQLYLIEIRKSVCTWWGWPFRVSHPRKRMGCWAWGQRTGPFWARWGKSRSRWHHCRVAGRKCWLEQSNQSLSLFETKYNNEQTSLKNKFSKNESITVRIVSGKVSEEVDEHAAGGWALGLGDGASSAGPFAGGVQTLFVVLIWKIKQNLVSIAIKGENKNIGVIPLRHRGWRCWPLVRSRQPRGCRSGRGRSSARHSPTPASERRRRRAQGRGR